MLVDVHLDELDLALGGLDGLFQDRGELLARAAPGRPEIDQHRLALGFLDDVFDEGLRRRVLDDGVRGGGWFCSFLQHVFLALTPTGRNRPVHLIKWETAGECNRGFSRLPRPETASIRGAVAGGFEEFEQPVARNRRRPGIDQGMKVEHLVRHHGGVEHHRDAAGVVVDGGERGHRAGLDAEQFAHQLGRAEREPAGRAQQPVQRFQLDRRVFQRHDQESRTLLVAQEQVLGVAAGDRAAQRRAPPRR